MVLRFTVKGGMRTLTLILVVLLATTLYMHVASALILACPQALPPDIAPYNYSVELNLEQGVSILDAIAVSRNEILVSLSNETLVLLKAPPSHQVASRLYIREEIAVLEYLGAREVLGVGVETSAGGEVGNLAFDLRVCGPECINAWMLAALDSRIVGYYKPVGSSYILLISQNGRVYNVSVSNPNIVNSVTTLRLNWSISAAYPVIWCSSLFYGFVLTGGTPTLSYTYLYNIWSRKLVELASNATALSAYYDPYIDAVLVPAVDSRGRLLILVYQAGSIYTLRLDVGSVRSASFVPGSRPPQLLVYSEDPAPRLLLYKLEAESSSISARLEWSIPLPGTAQLISFLEGCPPRHVLVAVKDASGILSVHLVGLDMGRHYWVILTGIHADEARALHYSEGWFLAATEDAIYAINVARLQYPLYTVAIGVGVNYTIRQRVVKRLVPFTGTLTCLDCPMPLRLEVQGSGLVNVALRPGTYLFAYQSPEAGMGELVFRLLSRTECAEIRAPQDPIIAWNRLYHVRVCVYSKGDPQGWGFGRGPIVNAAIYLESRLGLRINETTGADGCANFTLPKGVYTLRVIAEGFHVYHATLNISSDGVIPVYLEPYYARVTFIAVASDTHKPIVNATIRLTWRNVTVELPSGYTVLLPPGSYQAIVQAMYYKEQLVKLNIPPLNKSIEIEKRVVLQPVLYNTLLELVLQTPLSRNATAIIRLTRFVDSVKTVMTLREMIPAKVKVVRLPLRLVWGTYHAEVLVPLHQPASIDFRVPTPNVVRLEMRVVQYKLVVKTIDAVTGREVIVPVTASTPGYKTSFTSGSPIYLPIGNYTLTIHARFYNPVEKKIVLNRDTTVEIVLTPVRYPVSVKVLLGKTPLANTTVRIYGLAFNGVSVNTTVVTGKDGEALIRLLPGNYTFSASYTIRSWLIEASFHGETRQAITGPTTVKVVINPSPLLLLIHYLPYIAIGVIVTIIVLVFVALRHAIKERFRKLREALAERLGRVPEEEEGLEELF